jgi:subtilisin family serine protease
MTLTLDLSSVNNCYLDFMFKEFSDESHLEDHLSISEDGLQFYTVYSLVGCPFYDRRVIDLDEAAANHGISLSNTFKIRFSWKDDSPIPADGFAFDDIRIDSGDPPQSVPGYNLIKLQATHCWDIGITGEDVLILTIDSGVDYNHSDLADQIWRNPGEAPFGNNGIDDDDNGYIDDFMGWDFADNDNDPYPLDNHGTATAGIVCGDGTGGSITGMAPDATLAIARTGDMMDYWEAQQYAILIGARVITASTSYKWGWHDPDYHMFRTHCEIELVAGVIHANSIGNQGDDPVSFPVPFNISTPGNCPGPWIHPQQVIGGTSSVMSCSGINVDGSLYEKGGQGPSAWEDMLIYDPLYSYPQNTDYWDYPYGGFGGGMPGLLKPDVCTYTHVKTTELGGGYLMGFTGTSAATPHLGGAMCLLVSGNRHVSPRKVSQSLQETAVDMGLFGKDQRYGAGKIQVYDALERILHNVQFTDHEPSIGETTYLEVSGIPGEYYALLYSLSQGSTSYPGIGTFELGEPISILLCDKIPPAGSFSLPVTIPDDPAYVGITVYLQGVMKDIKGATGKFLISLLETLEIKE